MGSNQSSHANDIVTTTTNEAVVDVQRSFEDSSSNEHNRSVRGRKATIEFQKNHHPNDPTETTERMEDDFLHSDDDELIMDIPLVVMEVDDESEDDDSQEEDAEEDEERERILNDMKQLKRLADMYMHPEAPVQVDGTAMARCYFDRFSAPTACDEDEVDDILSDAAALKSAAVQYLHPEASVVTTDPCACGRNYFDRISAPLESVDEAEERALILADAIQLKMTAMNYMHPELPVDASTVDPTLFGRNYFTTPSAMEQQEQMDDDDERHPILLDARHPILLDAMAIKKLAVDYAHPERTVTTTDPTLFGRNYFTRPSAATIETEEECREQVLADMEALKKLAVDYLHPEMPVVTSDPTIFARNYFTRPSAPEQDHDDERKEIQADCLSLKKLAIDYAHPEIPVITFDPTAFGRNFYTRPSAPTDDVDDVERDQVLADMAALKKLAVDYLHPDMPVANTTDPTVFGRNFFTRPSAFEYDVDEETQRDQVLADMNALKKLAVDYLQPERKVVVDPTAFGRNYFTRPSAPEQDDDDDEDRAQAMADMSLLKKLAVDYLHPETPVLVDSVAFGRNYFTRPSAPEFEDDDDSYEVERERVLADMAALKKLAVDYHHPELPVVTTDSAACGRNYFTRYSAPERQQDDDDDASAEILAEMASLKKLAVDYLHPEMSAATTDPAACGRNYFTRPSAPEQEDCDEMELTLSDAASLKKLAVDFLHPELPITTADSTLFGRNYFTRPSAPENTQDEDADEVQNILADAKMLKNLAVDYAHPETPVVTLDPTLFGRNYFTRPSAPAQEILDEVEDCASTMKEASLLKQSAMDYAHPELPCDTSDPTATARNYFSRPSAPGHTGYIHTSGYDNHEGKQEYEDHHCESEHHDHFEMDEDIWDHMYSSLHLPNETVALKGASGNKNNNEEHDHDGEEEEEGKLSRSPSSVMLFEQGMEGY